MLASSFNTSNFTSTTSQQQQSAASNDVDIESLKGSS